jgi:uncharacterized protein (TIGR02271 family)
MEHENSNDRFAALEERFAGYEVHDDAGGKVGEIDEIFVDENGLPEYVGLKTGSPEAGSPLIPLEAVRVDERRRVIEVPLSKGKVEDGPSYHDDWEATPDFERRVRRYYGLRYAQNHEGRGSYTDHRGADDSPPSVSSGLVEPAKRGSAGHGTTIGEGETESDHQERSTGGGPGGEGTVGSESGLGVNDEFRMQRSEEELRTGTREREAGRMNVRKTVRTEREQVRVPRRREEIDIERVPGQGREASEAEIGEEEIVVQVFEEEVVVSKRVVLKEEIRIRKKVVEDEEVVEVDLRKEEVDIEDNTERDAGRRAGRRAEAAKGHEDGESKR